MKIWLTLIVVAASWQDAGAQSATDTLFSMDQRSLPVPVAETKPQIVNLDEDFSPELPKGEPPASVNAFRGGEEETDSREPEEEKVYAIETIPYLDIVLKEAKAQNFDPEMILAVIRKESSFYPKAESSAGAVGLMQLMPDTAAWLGLKDTTKLTNPSTNIKYGVKYLRYLFGEFCEVDGSQLKTEDIENQSVKKSIAAYNAGPGNVRKYSKAPYNGIPPFKETKTYLKLVSRYFTEFEVLDIPALPAPAK